MKSFLLVLYKLEKYYVYQSDNPSKTKCSKKKSPKNTYSPKE